MKYLPLSLNASFLYIIVIVLSSALVATAAVGSGDGAPSHPTRIHFAAPLHTVSTTRRTTTTTSSSSFRQCQHTTTCCFIIPSRFHRGRNDDETLSRGLLRLGVLKDEGGQGWLRSPIGFHHLPRRSNALASPSSTSSFPSRRRLVGLAAKKGKGGSTSSPSSSSSTTKKIQVKLLKQVPGTGRVGEVVLVTPAFFQNKLLPTQSAVRVTDEQLERERTQALAEEQERRMRAQALREQLSQCTLVLKRKAGPNGQLFGGIQPRGLMEELYENVKNDYLNRKGVNVARFLDENGKTLNGDIKHTGVFGAQIALTSDISVTVKIVVEGEH